MIDFVPIALAASLDLGTTEIGFHRGLHDLAPVGRTRAVMYPLKAAEVYAVNRWTGELRRGGHPRAARILKYGAIGLNLGATAWNAHKIWGRR